MVGAISYSITCTVSGGKVDVVTTGTVPDGRYLVNGHDEDSHESLNVGTNATDGRPLLFASVTRYKES